MQTKPMTIKSVTISNVTIGDKSITWEDLFAAATQADQSLSAAYKAILAETLPHVKRGESEAYDRYTRSSVTTRSGEGVHAVGHGGWSQGPSRESQNEWYAWKDLLIRIKAILK